MWDVAIVGAGPAATATAISSALKGMSCILLDRSRTPRPGPGESLHPGIEPILRQLGVWDVVVAKNFLRNRGIQIQRQGSIRFEPYGEDRNGPWEGMQAWRPDFDELLLQRAKELGVETRIPCRARSPIVEHGRVVGVESEAGPVRCQFLIDASGSSHWLARHLAINQTKYSPPLWASYGYVIGDYPPAQENPLFICQPQGWTWIARVRETVFQWTKLQLNHLDGHQSQLTESEPRTTVPSELSALQEFRPTRSADVTWRLVDRPSGPGFLLVGDAAAILDPSSSRGILKAIMSGMAASHAISNVLSGQSSEERASHEYAMWLKNWFHHDASTISRFYAGMSFQFR